MCLHHANVKIVGVKGSEKYKFLGFSHNLIVDDEEFRVFKHLPNFKTYLAQKPEDVKGIILESYASPNPCYIRL